MLPYTGYLKIKNTLKNSTKREPIPVKLVSSFVILLYLISGI